MQPLVPVETPRHSICLIGAYPPARLGIAGGEAEVAIADHHLPFSAEPYFDGRRRRSHTEGVALAETYLTPLGLRREQCSPLTYLVKLFLFKDEHLAKYRRLGCSWPEYETRSHFVLLVRQSLAWLAEELALAQPKLVITLGMEVAGVLQRVPGLEIGDTLLAGHLQDLWVGETVYPALHLAGPDQLTHPRGEEHRLHWQVHLPATRQVVSRLVG